MALISSFAFVCQTSLTERDGVPSAIRIVDIFYIPDGVPQPLPPVAMSLFIGGRLTPDDNDAHSLTVILIRPNGEETPISIFENYTPAPPRITGSDKTFNAIGNLGVDPRQFGRHEFVVYFDGQPVASTVFTLAAGQIPNAPTEHPATS